MAHTPPGETRGRIFEFVRRRLLAGEPPTIREVQEAFGFAAVESARSHLEKLVEEGRLVKEAGVARGYRLPGHAEVGPPIPVPLLGRVQAGDLAAAVEDPEGYLPVHSKSGDDELFALRVRGDSMTGAGILDGDVVVVRRQPTAEHGEIVVALVEEEATVKRLRRQRGRVALEPENPDFAPIVPPADERLRILGKVIEVRRHLEPLPLLDIS